MDRYEELTRATFASLEAARAALDSHLSDEGYIMTVLHTRRVGHNKDGDVKAVILQFSYARKAAVNSEFNQRKRVCVRRGTGCLFKCAVWRGVQQDDEETHWIVEIDIHDHSHESFIDPAVHPQERALTGEQWQEINQAAIDRQKPIQIVAAMRRHGLTITPRDVYNIKQAERQRILAGRSPLVALLDGLEDRPEIDLVI